MGELPVTHPAVLIGESVASQRTLFGTGETHLTEYGQTIHETDNALADPNRYPQTGFSIVIGILAE
jgi:hypothetical protein